jgi:hypothetical protein
MAFCDSEIITSKASIKKKIYDEDKFIKNMVTRPKRDEKCMEITRLKTISEEPELEQDNKLELKKSKKNIETSISRSWEEIIKPKKKEYTQIEFIEDILFIIPKNLPQEISEEIFLEDLA